MLRFALSALMLLPISASAETAFHFFGADNCPPCVAFKRDYLAGVQAIGQAEGFAVQENTIRDLRDMDEIGVFGSADPILRAALGAGPLPYPPVFVVTQNGAVLSAHGADWQAALLAARDAE